MDVKIIGNDADLGLLWVLNIIETHLNRLDNLGEEAKRVGELTYIYHENVGGSKRFTN